MLLAGIGHCELDSDGGQVVLARSLTLTVELPLRRRRCLSEWQWAAPKRNGHGARCDDALFRLQNAPRKTDER